MVSDGCFRGFVREIITETAQQQLGCTSIEKIDSFEKLFYVFSSLCTRVCDHGIQINGCGC